MDVLRGVFCYCIYRDNIVKMKVVIVLLYVFSLKFVVVGFGNYSLEIKD